MRQKGINMRTGQTVEISVKSFFTGMDSAEQVFFDLLRRRIAIRLAIGTEPSTVWDYPADNAVFSDIHALERESCYE